MAISLLHQCGHNNKWSRDSFLKDNIGSGLILSPVHMAKNIVEGLDESIKHASLFDPQFYLPSSQKKKLKSYDFFPETISSGFQTGDFAMHALDAAKKCIEFQASQEFRGIVIPTRYFDQMISDFCEKQNTYTVQPFVEVLSKSELEAPVYLNLVLTSHMILDEKFRTNILNWISSFPEIDGLYLIPDFAHVIKQVNDADFLEELLVMLHQLREVDLNVIVGYQNTESLLMTLVPDVEITFGSFENTRMFSLDKFLESDGARKGPLARIYVPGLLNWIQLRQAKDIQKRAPDLWDKIHMPTEYSEQALTSPVEPTFNQPQLYKHHFIVYQNQIAELDSMTSLQRYQHIREWINSAIESYEELDRRRIDLEQHGRGDFLEDWRIAINRHWEGYLA